MSEILSINSNNKISPVSETARVGRLGEEIAHRFLMKNRCRLVVANFKVPVGRNSTGATVTGEIDIIALDADDVLCFVEVKTRTSDAFAAPIAAVDLRKQRQIFYKRMGDPHTPEGKAQLERQSPLNHVARIKTPLMIVQGANDPRVKKSESDQIVIALRDRNYPIQYLLADDEGHGFQRPVNNMALFAEAEKFLAKYLKGRFQETITDDAKKRLKEITINPKTVVMENKSN